MDVEVSAADTTGLDFDLHIFVSVQLRFMPGLTFADLP